MVELLFIFGMFENECAQYTVATVPWDLQPVSQEFRITLSSCQRSSLSSHTERESDAVEELEFE